MQKKLQKTFFKRIRRTSSNNIKNKQTHKTKNTPQKDKSPQTKESKNPKAEDCFIHIFFVPQKVNENVEKKYYMEKHILKVINFCSQQHNCKFFPKILHFNHFRRCYSNELGFYLAWTDIELWSTLDGSYYYRHMATVINALFSLNTTTQGWLSTKNNFIFNSIKALCFESYC